MDTMERDPLHIAAQVRRIRKVHRLTQDNLADAANLTVRTIQNWKAADIRQTSKPLAA